MLAAKVNAPMVKECFLSRYGETGYLYNIHSPINPENGEENETYIGIINKFKTYGEL